MSLQDLLKHALQCHPSATISLVAGALILYGAVLRFWMSPLRKMPYPPGPLETSVISGCSNIIPVTKPWVTYAGWAKEYGPILHYRIFGQHTIILSSIEDCVELLEKRSNLYSDRPAMPMIDLMGWDFAAGMMRYGHRWRAQRRLLQQTFKRDAVTSFRPVQTRKINDFLYALLTSPDDFRDHCKTVAAAIIMAATYGYDISPKQDYFVTLAENSVAKVSQSFFPGAALVNALPVLRFLPSWFPGAGFQKFAAESRELTRQMLEVPFQYAEDKMAQGNTCNCLVADQLVKCKSENNYAELQNFAAVSYAAGADTATSTLGTFFYAMAISPEIQRKAQREIDIVVGTDRLPNYDDRASLPYVEALYREILRWRPVLPLSMSHAVIEDDIFKGYLIPKGATIMANVWAIAHDPERYQNPEQFRPDRFFDSNGDLLKDDVEYAFGFGRRICPGRHMASATVWLAIATVLSTFDIGKKKDTCGNEVPISEEYTDGLISHMLPHECSIIARSKEAKEVIIKATSQKSQGSNNL